VHRPAHPDTGTDRGADGRPASCDVVAAAADRVTDSVALAHRYGVAQTGVAMCLRGSVEAEAL